MSRIEMGETLRIGERRVVVVARFDLPDGDVLYYICDGENVGCISPCFLEKIDDIDLTDAQIAGLAYATTGGRAKDVA